VLLFLILLLLPVTFNTVPAFAENLRFVSLGDSYTQGPGVKPSESWPAQLTHLLNEQGQTIELVANLAQSGNTSTEVLESQIPQLKKMEPQFVSLLIGVNDWAHGFTSTRYRKEIIRILDSLLEIVTTGRILIVTAPEFSCSPTGKKWGYGKSAVNGIQRMNRILVEEAKNRHLTWVDIFPLSQELCPKKEMFSEDGMHPSAKQYQLWVNTILPVMTQMLEVKAR
jgi:acyl-CoA thioesterase I